MLSDDHVDADLLGAQANDSIRRSWDIQDAAARACVTRRNADACKAALAAQLAAIGIPRRSQKAAG